MNVGLLPTFFAAEEGLDFVVRKNEALVSGLVGQVFILVHFQNLSGFVELAFFDRAALGLDLAELSKGALELAGETLAVDADVGEGPVVLAVRAMARAASAWGWLTRMRSSISVMPSEKRLDSTAAARLSCQEVSRRDWTSWVSMAPLGWHSSNEGLGVVLVRGEVLGGQDDGLAGQAVAQRVEGGALFTGFGAGAGGFCCVSAIDCSAVEAIGYG